MTRLEELEAIHAVTRTIAAAERFEDVGPAVLDGVRATLGADRAALLLADDGGTLRFRAWSGLSDAYRARTEGHSPWAADDPDPQVVVIEDTAADPRLGPLREVVLAEGIGALAFVPLTAKQRLLGKFMLYFDAPRALGEAELHLARILADQVGFALARFRADEAARLAYEELGAVLAAVGDAVTVQAPDGNLRFANLAAARLVGLSSGEEMVRTPTSRYAREYRMLREDGGPLSIPELPNRRALAGESVSGVVGYEPVAGGPVRWSRVVSQPCFDAEGRVRFAVTVTHDVTQTRRDADTRRFLLESGALLASSLDIEVTLRAVAALAVPRLADWCALELVGDMPGERLRAVHHRDPAKIAVARRMLAEYPPDPDGPGGTPYVCRTGEPFVVRTVTPAMTDAVARDDEHRRMLREIGFRSLLIVPLKMLGRVLGTLTLANTESLRAFDDEDLAVATKLADRAAMAVENARLYTRVREAQDKLELAMEAGRMGNWEYDPAAGTVWWSPAVAALHGVALEDFDGTFEAFLRDVVPADRARVVDEIRATVEARDQLAIEYRIALPGGAIRWVEGRGRVYRDAAGRARRVAGFCLDISDRKRAEEALQAAHERLAVTLASIGDAVVATDRTGAVTLMNGVAESLTGWTAAEATGRPLPEIFPIYSEKTGLPVPNPVEEVLRTGRIVGLAHHTVLESRDGTRRSIADSAAPIRDSAGECVGVVLVFRDVTHQERLEREMAKASKLESIGVLAGGIAHDFNNILTSITANVSLAEHRLVRDHPAQPRLVAARAGCDRARDLTRQLLTFSRGGAPVKASTSVAQILHEACGFALQGANVRADFSLDADLWPVDADGGQLSQVVHNLALNAVQAMPAGGRLRVRAENVVLDATSWLPLPPGRYVRFAVADDGPGIPEDVQPRIFDPFFTTKPNGSGLGLATSYSVVRRHGGHIGAESPAGGGAVFTVHLPASATEPAPGPQRSATPHGRGRILVMDDDPAILELAGECLRELGYEPEFAADGATAIERYERAREAGAAHDVILMDLTVPGAMGGREMLRRLRERFPDVRAIVSSGYSNDPVMAAFREHGFVAAVPKPYALEELAQALKDALGPRP